MGTSEDTVYYSLYFPFSSSIQPLDQTSFLQEKSALILSELHQFLNGYIWHKDKFQLRIVQNESDPNFPFLYGKTRFGDCIDDEWFIVFLLKHISMKFQDVVMSVSDNDGEFLLIEAAIQLPSWLNPSNSENRVFIYQDQLHIIPLPKTLTEIAHIPTGRLSVEKAVQLVRNDVVDTKADSKVQQTVFSRTLGYPEKVNQNFHSARCYIPKAIAHVLYHNPQLVAPAVEAFYTRDPIALKACRKMQKFPPYTSITVSVKFTKTLYAQLVSQRFNAPKSFIMPMSTSKKYPAAELGMKLLENIAKEQFLKYQSQVDLLDDSENSSPLEQIDEILNLPIVPDEVLMSNTKQDDDSWLNVDPKQLDELLNATNKSYEEIQSESDDELNPVDLTNMIDTFEKFLDFEGASAEGAEFPGEHISDEEDDEEEEHIYMDDDADINVDPTEFLRIMRQTLGISEQEYRELANEKIKQESDKFTREFVDQSESSSSQQFSDSLPEKIQELNDNLDMVAYMQALDAELSSSKISGSFIKTPQEVLKQSSSEDKMNNYEYDDDELNEPVNINLNLAKNFLESFKSQEGLPGPVGNIFGRMGIGALPRDDDDDDYDDDNNEAIGSMS
ncbi:SGT1-domain-containing protein [Gigaspora margarita]|uniref:SGT1-domain-containing protein n=2 Tax=Gigaspora margarita TaxID=4874 RepID=A0A8H4AGK8_GIGMA|nr:SGT1-domain-containing protein [Gigaspora margarita]